MSERLLPIQEFPQLKPIKKVIKIPKVSIRIESEPTTDRYLRSHAKVIDGTLDNTGHWQETQPEYFIGFQARLFTHEQEVDLPAGRHSIEYAASGYVPDHAWHAKIYVNDKLVAEGDVGRRTHLKSYFAIGPLALTVLPTLGVIPIIRPMAPKPSIPAPEVARYRTRVSIKTY